MVTVADVLAHPQLDLRQVVAGDEQAPVRWVATSELADPSPFLEGGEVLLTTGINTTAWREQWHPYVDRLAAARVVAIGLAVGLTHATVPEELAAACTGRGLTLFEVPRPTTFVAISRATAQMLQDQDATAARQALAMQRELTQAAVRRDDPTAVLRRLADVLRGAVGALGVDGHWEVPPVGAADHGLDIDEVAAEVRRLGPQGLRASAVLAGRDATVVLQPVGLRGEPSTYLAVWAPGRLEDAQRSAVSTAVALLSLLRESRNDQRETTRRLRRRALELLVEGDPRTASVVLAAAAGLAPAEVRFGARLQMLRATGTDREQEQALVRLEERAAERGPLPLAGRVGEQLWVATAPAHAERLAEDLVESGLRVGLGSVVRRDAVGRSHAAAGHALGHTGATAPLVRWDELVHTGVLALLEPSAGSSFAAAFLAPLDAYGQRRAELVDTLRAFLRHHGRVGPLVEELGVHRNTVRNRLREVETALGRSLDDPQTRVNLWVALQMEATSELREVDRSGPHRG